MFRGRAGTLIKALWHDGVGLSLYAKRLDRGCFIWPSTVDGVVALSKLGENITETLEVIPKSWKVIQHVREKFSCRDC